MPDWGASRHNQISKSKEGGRSNDLPPSLLLAELFDFKVVEFAYIFRPDITQEKGSTAKDLARLCDYFSMTIRLTPRQAEVLALVAQGLTDRQIAERLVISPRTVGTHVWDAMTALDAATRAHAVYLYFLANGGDGHRADATDRTDGATGKKISQMIDGQR